MQAFRKAQNYLTSRSDFIIGALFLFFTILLFLHHLHRPIFVDEYSFLMNVAHFGVFKTILPIYTNYPTAYSYFISIPVYIAVACFLAVKQWPLEFLNNGYLLAELLDARADLWLMTGRFVSAALMVILAASVINYCRKKFGSAGGYAAVFCFLFAPREIFDLGVYLNADMPVVILAFFTMYYLYHFVESGRLSDYARVCIFTAVAAGSKLNGILLILPVLAAPWFAPKIKNRLRTAVAAFFGILAIFLMTSPVFLLDPCYAVRGFYLETVVLYYDNPQVLTGIDSLTWPFLAAWKINPEITALFIITFFYTLIKKSSQNRLFHVLCIATYVVLSQLEKRTFTYFLFLYPVFVFHSAELVSQIFTHGQTNRPYKTVLILLLMIGTCRFFYAHPIDVRSDNRETAKEWIIKNIDRDALIALDWGYTPDIDPKSIVKYFNGKESILRPPSDFSNTGKYKPVHEIKQARPFHVLRLIGLKYEVEAFLQERPHYAVISSYCYQPYETWNIKDLQAHPELRGLAFSYFRFYQLLRRGKLPYTLIKEFSDGLGPTIEIYQYSERK